MGKWAEKAALVGKGEPRANSANSAKSPPIGANDTIGTASPSRILRFWHSKLDALDPAEAPEGFGAKEWWQLWEDACWLYSNHASYAVRHGWDAASLFGVRVGYPEGGGLAQLLQSSRSVVFDGPIVHVRRFGVTMKRNAACGHGLPLMWELSQ